MNYRLFITVCPGSSGPFYIASLLYKMCHYFLDILYSTAYPRYLSLFINENWYYKLQIKIDQMGSHAQSLIILSTYTFLGLGSTLSFACMSNISSKEETTFF